MTSFELTFNLFQLILIVQVCNSSASSGDASLIQWNAGDKGNEAHIGRPPGGVNTGETNQVVGGANRNYKYFCYNKNIIFSIF